MHWHPSVFFYVRTNKPTFNKFGDEAVMVCEILTPVCRSPKKSEGSERVCEEKYSSVNTK